MAQTRLLSSRNARATAALDAVVRALVRLGPGPARREPRHTPERILVLELWGLGDVILVTPLLAELRERFPLARITLLAKPAAEVLLSGSGLVDEIVAFDFPWTAHERKYAPWRYDVPAIVRLFARLRARKLDLSLDARRDIRSNVVAYLSGATRRIGFDFGGGESLLTDAVPAGDQQAHRSDDWLQLLEPVLGERPNPRPPILCVTADEADRARDALCELQLTGEKPVVAIDPGASHRVRRLRSELVGQVAQRLIADGRSDVVLLLEKDAPVPAVPHGMKVLRLGLRELMAMISVVDVLVCSDSAPMHIAAALHTPTVAVFGPQPRQWFAPRGGIHRTVQIDPMPCRPCFDRCIYSSPMCMDAITPAAIFHAIDQQLGALTGTGPRYTRSATLSPA